MIYIILFMQVLTQISGNTKSVEEKMSRQAQNSRIGLTLIKLMLLLCMGVIIEVKAQAGRLPDDEGKIKTLLLLMYFFHLPMY
jgi:hypothetical protein